MTYDPEADSNVRNYRVDRMDTVEVQPGKICKDAKAKIRTVSKYTEQVFRMYGGRTEKVTLLFDKKLIGTVYDKFGEKTKIKKKGEEYSAAVEVQISPIFWSWLTTFKGNMVIAQPQEIADEFKAWINEIQNWQKQLFDFVQPYKISKIAVLLSPKGALSETAIDISIWVWYNIIEIRTNVLNDKPILLRRKKNEFISPSAMRTAHDICVKNMEGKR